MSVCGTRQNMRQETERLEDSNVKEEECICHWFDFVNPKTDTEGFLTAVSVLCLSCGLALIFVGYIVPRDYAFDPLKPAREMEAIEIHYATLSFYLDVCILIGMACIALGGLISSGIFMYHFVTGTRQVYRKEDRSDLNLLSGSYTEMMSYGTRSDN